LLAVALIAGCAGEPGDSGPPDGSPVTGIAEAPDGLPIHYEARGAGDTALVLVHCWACDRQFWREQLEPLAESYRVVSLDLGGHGESAGARQSWRVLDYGGDVKAVADALGLERIILVGHSMGGPVALEAARLMPGRVLGVVCVDTLHDADFEMPDELVEQWLAGFEQDFEGAMAQAMSGMAAAGLDPAVRDWIVERATAVSPEMAISLMRDFGSIDFPELFRAAGVPIRCVNSAPPAAPATNVEGNRRYADYDAVVVEGVGHFLHMERPEQVNEHLLSFIAELDSTGE
jgi:pimeloyl-ACP methyl ester carboxylesterase